jgi:hypothetical protein
MPVHALVAQAQFCNMPINDHFGQAKSGLAQDLQIVPYRPFLTQLSSSTSA